MTKLNHNRSEITKSITVYKYEAFSVTLIKSRDISHYLDLFHEKEMNANV